MSKKRKFDFKKHQELKVKYRTIIKYFIYLIVILMLIFLAFNGSVDIFDF